MTPAINLAKKLKVAHQVHEYSHNSSSESYGLEAAEKMGVDPARVFKTLVVQLDGKDLAVGIVPVCSQMSMKLLAKAAGVKKASMASPDDVQRSTGYVLGGVSPLGQKKRLKTLLDESAINFDTIFVSAGKRGLEIELNPADLLKLVSGESAPLCLN